MKLRFVELVENTLPRHEEIRQTITSFDVLRLVVRVFTQRIISIIDADLRDQRKHSLTNRLKTRHESCKRRENRRANKAQQPVRTCREFKHAIRGFEQPLGICEPLFGVCLQQPLRRDSFNNESQFPRKVVGVLNAGVHTLRACRAVNVRGISSDSSALSLISRSISS